MRTPRNWERAWLYGFVQSETFTRGFLGLILGIGVGFVTVACSTHLVRQGHLELCAFVIVIGVATVAPAIGQLTRAIAEASRSYHTTRRLVAGATTSPVRRQSH